MTRDEQKVNSIEKEITKLNERIARAEAKLEKKTAAAEKQNAIWTQDEHYDLMIAGLISPKQEDVWFDYFCATRELDDLQDSLARAQKRLAKATGIYEANEAKRAQADEIERIGNEWIEAIRKQSAEEREREYQKWLAGFKARCAKDGVIIDEASHCMVKGLTKSGKRFWMFINSGVTTRSLHCYSLRIDGELIFTSGDFGTAYARVKR